MPVFPARGKFFVVVYLTSPERLAGRSLPVLPDSTERDGVVALLYCALLKLPADVTMGWFVQGNDHDARGVEIQPMHDTGRGVILLQARDKAVFVFWMAPWNGQQQVRLAH